MKKFLVFLTTTVLLTSCTLWKKETFKLPEPEFIRGIALAAPQENTQRFVDFINQELAPRGTCIIKFFAGFFAYFT